MKDCKIIAFDFDGTLYSGTNDIYWKTFCDNWFKNFFKFLPKDEFEELYQDFCNQNQTDEAIIKILIKRAINVNVWLDYRDKNNCEKDFKNAKVVSNLLLKKLAENHILYIVSNSTVNNIKFQAERLGIDLSYFKNIIVNKYENGYMGKEKMMLQIIKDEKVKLSEFLMVGDSFAHDVKPAIEIGANGCLVKDASFSVEDLETNMIDRMEI